MLNDLIDYTQSHFTFEESLQEQAQYQYPAPHKCVHDLFIRKIDGYRARFLLGKHVENDLYKLLIKWLINHIQHDDADYVDAVRDNTLSYIRQQENKKGKSWFAKFFG